MAASGMIDPLADLRCRFLARSRQRVAELATILRTRSLDAAALEQLVGLAHQLAGSAGTFGCSGLGGAAARLEDAARAALATAAAVDSAPYPTARLRARLDVVESALLALHPAGA